MERLEIEICHPESVLAKLAISTIETGTTGEGTGESNSIVIDDGGTMHVAYSDETNGVLRYATKSTV